MGHSRRFEVISCESASPPFADIPLHCIKRRAGPATNPKRRPRWQRHRLGLAAMLFANRIVGLVLAITVGIGVAERA